jgi:hypothetical protein
MKQYPTIARTIDRGLQIYAFDKIDGSNIRAEWSRKNGFYKFGSRNVLMDVDHELGEAVKLIQKGYAFALGEIFRKQRWDRAICFFEFSGPNSFAGQHVDEPHKVVLIDVNPHKKGIEPPRDFIRTFGDLGIPTCLHVGKATVSFEQSVRDGTLSGLGSEGVVCKGVRKGRHLTMFKIKSDAWIAKLKDFCGDDEKKFQRLL